MYFYTKDNKKINPYIKKDNRLGGELHGNVYKLTDDICIKIYKKSGEIDKEVLELIKELNLRNFYQIYDLLFDKKGLLKAYTMKYYKQEEIDILTMPILYTLNNLFNLLSSVDTLSKNNISICDLHTGNMILGDTNITIIDTDLYTFNKFYTMDKLEYKNIDSLAYLFQEIYLEALITYHPKLYTKESIEIIKNLFQIQNKFRCEKTFMLLEQYDYPIDYIKRRIKTK